MELDPGRAVRVDLDRRLRARWVLRLQLQQTSDVRHHRAGNDRADDGHEEHDVEQLAAAGHTRHHRNGRQHDRDGAAQPDEADVEDLAPGIAKRKQTESRRRAAAPPARSSTRSRDRPARHPSVGSGRREGRASGTCRSARASPSRRARGADSCHARAGHFRQRGRPHTRRESHCRAIASVAHTRDTRGRS